MRREKRRKTKIYKENFIVKNDMPNEPLITNVPINEKGNLMVERAQVQAIGKLFKGQHRVIRVILTDSRGFPYLREVIQ